MENFNNFLHIPYDPLEYYKFDTNNEEDKNLMEDMRYSILEISKNAFKFCVKNHKNYLDSNQEKCINNYLLKIIENDKYLYNK